MPTPTPPAEGPLLSRRAALCAGAALAGALVLAGCTGEDSRPRRTAASPNLPEVDPDVAVAAAALSGERAMLDLLEATQERHPGLTDALSDVVAAHEAHVAVLVDAVPADLAQPASPSPAGPSTADPTVSDGPSPAGPSVPPTAAGAVAALVAAEQQLVVTTKRQAFKARSGAFARVLGSMAAASAQQGVLLGRLGAPEGAS